MRWQAAPERLDDNTDEFVEALKLDATEAADSSQPDIELDAAIPSPLQRVQKRMQVLFGHRPSQVDACDGGWVVWGTMGGGGKEGERGVG